MNTHKKALVKNNLAKLTLERISAGSPISNFSWQRVRIALLNIHRCQAYYVNDYLRLEFSYHKHSVLLHKNGTGVLYNPWQESSPKYKLIMPAEVQKLVQEIWDTNRAPIPINMAAN